MMRLCYILGIALSISACSSASSRVNTLPGPAGRNGENASAIRNAGLGTLAPSEQNAALPPDSMAGIRSHADTVASSEEVARTVLAVFGDAAALKVSTSFAAELEHEWVLDVRSYETHERVAHYVDLFSGSARERFEDRLSRGTRYDEMIRSKLRAGGLPEDLKYLALIESGFDPNAYSRAAAVGMWQFMSSTARDVGLRVDWWVDERRDPALSTDAAVRFLTELQKQFGGSLYLAAAAYNGGPGRVSRGLSRFADEMGEVEGEDRFFALADQDYLKAETKNYVPQLIAAALVARMPDLYGLRIRAETTYSYDSLLMAPGTSLAAVSAASGATVSQIRELNGALLRGTTPPDAAYWVKLPPGTGLHTSLALDSLPESSRLAYSTRAVKGGRTSISSLAKSAGVTSKQLTMFNPSLRTTKSGYIVAGQKVRVPESGAVALARDVPNPSIEKYGTATVSGTASKSVHLVRRGETMGGIAKKYGLTVARLRSLNGMKGTRVLAGQTLRVRAVTTKKATKSAAR